MVEILHFEKATIFLHKQIGFLLSSQVESNNVPQVDVGTIEVNCIRGEETDAMIFKFFFNL